MSGELVVGGLRGFRWWGLDREGWLFSPWRGKARWETGPNRATCLYRRRFTTWRPSKAPHPQGAPDLECDCDCGFYALHTIPHHREHPAPFGWEVGVHRSGDRGLGLVFGVAAAHGRVLVGTDGWRAEMARPLALFWSPQVEPDERFERMQERYGLPTCRALEPFVGEWGPGEAERDLSAAA